MSWGTFQAIVAQVLALSLYIASKTYRILLSTEERVFPNEAGKGAFSKISRGRRAHLTCTLESQSGLKV